MGRLNDDRRKFWLVLDELVIASHSLEVTEELHDIVWSAVHHSEMVESNARDYLWSELMHSLEPEQPI